MFLCVFKDEYQKLREKVCAHADVYLVLYDIGNPSSLERVRDQWIPEIKGYNSSAPFVLVANKSDERIKAQVIKLLFLDNVQWNLWYKTLQYLRKRGHIMGVVLYKR